MMIRLLKYGFLLMLAAWLGGFLWFSYHINHYQADNTTHTEAVIALTGGRNRIAEAVRLLNDGRAERLFISGVGQNISLRDIKKRQKINILAENRVTLGTAAKDTVGNAAETAAWIEDNNIRSIRLVTSNYHLPRSIIEFRHTNPQIQIVAHPVYSEKVSKKWWTSWHTFSLIFAEYNKFIYGYLRSCLTK